MTKLIVARDEQIIEGKIACAGVHFRTLIMRGAQGWVRMFLLLQLDQISARSDPYNELFLANAVN